MLYQKAAERIASRARERAEVRDFLLKKAMQDPDFAQAVRRKNALAPLAARGEKTAEYRAADREASRLAAALGVGRERFSCPVCRDTGFTEGKPCACLRQAVNDLIAENLLSGLEPASFEDARSDIFGPERRKFFDKVYAEGRKLAENPESLPQSVVVYCGKTGTGKSYLARCIMGGLLRNRRTVLALSSYSFFDLLSGLYRNEDKRVVMSALADSDALIVDDLGCEACGEYARNIFVSLLSARMETRKLTLFTTNLLPKDLQSVYGERALSRLLDKSKSKIYLFDGSDLRLSSKQGG